MRHIGNVHTGIGSIFGKARERLAKEVSPLSEKVITRGRQRVEEELEDRLPDLDEEAERELEDQGYRRKSRRGKEPSEEPVDEESMDRLPPASREEILDSAMGFVDVLAGLPMSPGVESALSGIDALLGDLTGGYVGDADDREDRQDTRQRGRRARQEEHWAQQDERREEHHDKERNHHGARRAKHFVKQDQRRADREDDETDGLVAIGNIEEGFWGDSWKESDDQRFRRVDDFGQNVDFGDYGYGSEGLELIGNIEDC